MLFLKLWETSLNVDNKITRKYECEFNRRARKHGQIILVKSNNEDCKTLGLVVKRGLGVVSIVHNVGQVPLRLH